jgi:hypothetical protein
MNKHSFLQKSGVDCPIVTQEEGKAPTGADLRMDAKAVRHGYGKGFMINRLTVKGFKGFEEFELPKMSRVTLLGGRNNVGKTSLLEALFMFFDRSNPQMILSQYARRGVGVVSLEPESTVAPIFFDYDTKRQIVISVSIDNVEEEMTLKFNPNYARIIVPSQAKDIRQIETGQPPVQSYALDVTFHRAGSTKQIYHFWAGTGGLGLDADKIRIPPQQVIYISTGPSVNTPEDAALFGKLDIIGKQDKVLECLKILEPKLNSLSSVTLSGGTSSMVHGDIGLSRKIPVAYMGEGMSRLLKIILALANFDVVLLDECENGFHYSVMPKVWESIGKAAREFGCQVIGTTHSYECLHAAHKGFTGEMSQDLTFVRIDKMDGRAVAKTFDYELLGTAIDSSMEVR